MQGFHDGSLVNSPPAKAGDTGSIPDPGRFPHAEQQLSQQVTPIEPVLHNSRGQREARTRQLESSPRSPPTRESLHSIEEPAQPKINF